jgi:carboxypeptidase PM20D1
MLRELAAYSGLGLKLIFANLWLFKPLVLRIMQGGAETAAMVHTTYALTELAGSKAANVIPTRARATVNVRVDPAETLEQAIGRVRTHFGVAPDRAGALSSSTTSAPASAEASADVKDSTAEAFAPVTVTITNEIEPSPVSPHSGPAYDYLRRVIRSVYPNAGIAPYVQTGRSDAGYFARICPHTYRFAGFLFRGNQRETIHGIDENLDVAAYKRGVGFYTAFIRNLDALR